MQFGKALLHSNAMFKKESAHCMVKPLQPRRAHNPTVFRARSSLGQYFNLTLQKGFSLCNTVQGTAFAVML